ncbi:MAG: carboxypeptidase regulatory-like domain-containing protein [Prevotella sp.]|jgi:hypothetical protein
MKRCYSLLSFAVAFFLAAMLSAPAWGSGQMSPPQKKNTKNVVFKEGASLPYYEDFNDSTFLTRWTQINVNELLSWYWSQYEGKGYSGAAGLNQRFGNGTACDNWFISPALKLTQGMTYRVSAYLTNWFDASLHVYLMKSPTDTVNKTKLFDYIGQQWDTYSADFEVDEDGDYYIGFHDDTPYRYNGTALSYQMYIDEFKVQTVSNNAVPAAIADLKQVPGQNGEVSMGLKWTVPTLSKKGEQLDALSYVKIFKDEKDSVIITDGVTPGAKMTWTDPNPTEGKHVYRVVVANTTGEGDPAVVNTFVGIDVPGAPVDLSADYDEGAEVITLDWDTPEFGVKGGWYDPTGLSYRIVRQPGNKVLATNLNDVTFEDDDLEEYGNYIYEVTSRNNAGLGGTAKTSGVVVGSAATLPIREDWEDSNTYPTWTIVDENGDGHTWTFNGYQGNGGPTCIGFDYTQSEVDKDETLVSPPVELVANKKYRVSFDVVNTPMSGFSLTVSYGKTKDDQSNEVVSLANVSSSSWNTVTQEIVPAESGIYYFSFWLHDTDSRYFYMDNIRIEEVLDKNLEASTLRNLNTAPTAGEKVSTGVTYVNRGTSNTSKFTVQLLDADNNVLGEQTVSRSVASGASGTANISWTVPEVEGSFAIHGKVVMDGDECEGDNMTKAAYLNIQPANNKAVTIGTSTDNCLEIPFRYYGYDLCESVYQGEDFLGYAGTIDSIAYKVRMGQSVDLNDVPFKIYMSTTTQNDLNKGWIPASQMQLVFDGTIDLKRGVYDLVIPLTTPFDYQGGNLCVMVVGEYDASQFLNNGVGMGTYCTPYGLGATRAQAYQDYYKIDPMNPDPNSGSFYAYVPNTMFFIDHSNTGSISGKVTDEEGNAVAGATVAVGYQKLMKTTTEDDGSYSLPYVPAGYASLTASAKMYQDAYGYSMVNAGESYEVNLTMQKAEPITFTGNVCDQVDNTIAIAGATIILDGDNYLTATTDAEGKFSIDEVYSGRPYTFIVKAEDYETISYSGMQFRSWNGQPYNWSNISMKPSTASPYSVTAIDNGDEAEISWSAPIQPINVTKAGETSIGQFGGLNEMFIGQRFSPEELKEAGLDSLYYLSALRYIPMCTATFKLTIWQGEKGNEALVYQEDMEPTAFEEWNTHELTHPYKVDLNQSLVVGYEVEARTGSYPIGFDAGPVKEGGDALYDNITKKWTTAHDELPESMNYNWALDAVFANNTNAAPVEWVNTEVANAAKAMRQAAAMLNGQVIDSATGMVTEAVNKDTATAEQTGYQLLMLEKPVAARTAAKAPARKQPKGYNIYRLECGQEENSESWTKLNSEPVTTFSYTDEGWDTIPQKPYRFAVTSSYGKPQWGNEIQSAATFSDGVDKGRYSTVTIKVLTDWGDAKGAEVALTGDGKVLKQTVDDTTGVVTFSNVHFNGYTLNVMKPYYKMSSKSVSVGQKTVADSIQLSFAPKPAEMLTAIDYIHEARLSWDAPSAAITDTLTKSTLQLQQTSTFNVEDPVTIGQHFSGDDLIPYEYTTFYIDSINFYAGADMTYNVQLWSGLEDHEVIVWSKDVEVKEANKWTGVRLDTPVKLDPTKSYYIAYTVTPESGKNPFANDAGPMNEGGCMYYGYDYTTYAYDWMPLSYNINWMMAAHVTNIADPKSVQAEDVTYNVYRMKATDKADESKWTRINSEPVSDLGYVDEGWEQLADDNYQYAVKAIYFDEVVADAVFSKVLPKGTVSLGTIKLVTNNGLIATGASVDLTNSEQTYHAVADYEGVAVIPEIVKGDYTVSVGLEGYDSVQVTKSFTEPEVSYTIQLYEITPAPVKVEAQASVNNDKVTVTWRKPGSYAPTEGWVYWDNGNVIGGFGSSTGSASVGQLFTPEDQTAKGMKELYISKISFFPTNSEQNPVSDGANWTVKVWRQTDDGFEEVASQRASDVTMDEWNDVTLDEPYYVSGSETLLVGYTFIGSGSVFGLDEGPCVKGKADWANFGQGWTQLHSVISNFDYNILVHTYCEELNAQPISSPAPALASAEKIGGEIKGWKISRLAEAQETTANHPRLTANLPVRGYVVYRLAEGDENDESTWTRLNPSAIKDSVFVDTEWTSVDPGHNYRWAVEAIYPSGVSEPAFSEALTTNGTVNIDDVTTQADVVIKQLGAGRVEVIVSRDAELFVANTAGMTVCHEMLKQGSNIITLNVPQGVYLFRVCNGLNYSKKFMLK